MSVPKVQYFMPETIGEACSLSSKYKGKARIIAGGTDLLVQMKQREVLPRYIINIRGISGQDYIDYDEREGLRIGALATIHSIAASPLIQGKFGILAQAASKLGTWQIRNRGTIAGNLCNAAPSAELAPALIVLGAKAKIRGVNGGRIIPMEDFFTGPGQTVLKPDELVAEIRVPNLAPRSGGVYIKHAVRKSLDLAIVGVAVIAAMDGDILSDLKIALGAVAPTPIRAKKAEEILKGKRLNDDLLEKASLTASNESSPIDDVRSSADYRRKMVRVLVARALRQAVEQIKAG